MTVTEVVRGTAAASHDGSAHPLTPLDNTLFIRLQSVPWAFFYKETLDPVALKASLARTLDAFPLAAGRVLGANSSSLLSALFGSAEMARARCIVANNAGVPFTVTRSEQTLEQLLTDGSLTRCSYMYPPNLPDYYNRADMPFMEPMTIHQVLGGKEAIMKVRLTQLAGGGSILAVNCHHCLLDARAYTVFMKYWAEQYQGESAANGSSLTTTTPISSEAAAGDAVAGDPAVEAAITARSRGQAAPGATLEPGNPKVSPAGVPGAHDKHVMYTVMQQAPTHITYVPSSPFGGKLLGDSGKPCDLSEAKLCSDSSSRTSSSELSDDPCVSYDGDATFQPSEDGLPFQLTYLAAPFAEPSLRLSRFVGSMWANVRKMLHDRNRAQWLMVQRGKAQGPTAAAAALVKAAGINHFTVRTVPMHIPAVDVARIKAIACAGCNPESAVPFVSTNDAIAAWLQLLMCYLRKRPLPNQSRPAGSQQTGMLFLVDLRTLGSTSAAAAAVPADHWGNAAAVVNYTVEPTAAAAAGGQLLSAETLGSSSSDSSSVASGIDGSVSSSASSHWSPKVTMREWQAMCSDQQLLEVALSTGAQQMRAAINKLRADPLSSAKLLAGTEVGALTAPIMQLCMFQEAYHPDGLVNSWQFPIWDVKFTGNSPAAFWGTAGAFPPYSSIIMPAHTEDPAGGVYIQMNVPKCLVKHMADSPIVKLLTPGARLVTSMSKDAAVLC